MSRFTNCASTSELVIDEKNAIRVELQEGKEGQPTELVLCELYPKDGKWQYTHSQVRVLCTRENVQFILDGVKAMYDASKKVVKTAKSGKVDFTKEIAKMSDEQKAALVQMLLGQAKAATPAPANAEPELNLESAISKILAKGTSTAKHNKK